MNLLLLLSAILSALTGAVGSSRASAAPAVAACAAAAAAREEAIGVTVAVRRPDSGSPAFVAVVDGAALALLPTVLPFRDRPLE